MKQNIEKQLSLIGRRSFIKSTGAGMIGVAGIGLLPSSVQTY